MQWQKMTMVALAAMALYPGMLSAQNPQQLDVLLGTALAKGLGLGINTSGGLTNWLTVEPPPPPPGDLKMVCPADQAWCAMFITDGPAVNPPRPGLDLSIYQTLIVEIMGDPGTTIDIGIKDALQPDDGTEAKVTLPVTSTWTLHSIPLSSFTGANLKDIYVLCEFVFNGGPQPQTVKVRTITYTTTGPPAPPTINSVVNGASFVQGSPVSPGSLATIFGTGFASKTYASVIPLPTVLSGVSVTVNDTPAPLIYVDPGQINFEIPVETAAGSAIAVVQTSGVPSPSFTFQVQTVMPGLFVALNNADSTPNGPAHPAAPGDFLIVYMTGQGAVSQPVQDGVPTPNPPPLFNATAPYSATIGPANAIISFLGLSPGFVGLAQADVQVPQLPSGTYPLVITVGGMTSNSVQISVH